MQKNHIYKVMLTSVLFAASTMLFTANIQNEVHADTHSQTTQNGFYIDDDAGVIAPDTIAKIKKFNATPNQPKLFIFTTKDVKSKDQKQYLTDQLETKLDTMPSTKFGVIAYLLDTKSKNQNLIVGKNILSIDDVNEIYTKSHVKNALEDGDNNSAISKVISNIEYNLIDKDADGQPLSKKETSK